MLLVRSVAFNYYISLMGSVWANGDVMQAKLLPSLLLLFYCMLIAYCVLALSVGRFGRRIMCGNFAYRTVHLCTLTIEIYCPNTMPCWRAEWPTNDTRNFDSNRYTFRKIISSRQNEADALWCTNATCLNAYSFSCNPISMPLSHRKMKGKWMLANQRHFKWALMQIRGKILQISWHCVWLWVRVHERWSVDGASGLRKKIDRTK